MDLMNFSLEMLKERLKEDLKAALKSGDGQKRLVIGMIMSVIKNRELEKRAKLAKRLLRVILTEVFKLDLQHPMGNNQTAERWISALLNNRGYTYLADEIDKELLSQSGVTIVHLRWPKEFPEQETLFSRLQRLNNELDVAKRLSSEFLGNREFFKVPAVQELMKAHSPE